MRGSRVVLGLIAASTILLAAEAWTSRSLLTPTEASLRSEAEPVKLTGVIQERELERQVTVRGRVTSVASWSSATPVALPNVVTSIGVSAGHAVEEGAVLMELGGSPVILLYGAFPTWRQFALGMAPGPDVAQLQAALSRLGMYEGDVDGAFRKSTRRALRSLGELIGYDLRDVLYAEQVMFVPNKNIRVDRVPAVGDKIGEGALILVSTDVRVDVSLTFDQAARATRGDRVRVHDGLGGPVFETQVRDVLRLDVVDDTDPNLGLVLQDTLPAGLGPSVTVGIVLERTDYPVIAVPPASVIEHSPGSYRVFVLDRGAEIALDVEVVFVTDDSVGVRSDDSRLAAGASLVLNPGVVDP